MKSKRGYLDISFGLIFGIVVGIIILGLAIYATIKFITSEQTVIDVKTSKEIGILLNPLETGFETGKTNSLIMPVETRFYNKCKIEGIFGEQGIQVQQKSFNKWTNTNLEINFPNKYIFSESMIEGEKFLLFSKPFEFPFKVGDVITMTSYDTKYCFVNAPENIAEELGRLQQENIATENCEDKGGFVKVCFSSGDCDINVNYNSKYVEREGEKVYFEGDALMYGAIFSDKETYECELKRLIKRMGVLSLLYKDKAVFIARANCNSNLNPDLLVFGSMAGSYSNSLNLGSFNTLKEEMERKNGVADCKLW